MILKETILSAFTERGTLLKWLKKVEAALNNAVLTDISVEQVSATQVKLKFTFENGDFVESPVLTLPRGEKGEPGKDGAPGKDGLDGEGIAATIEVGTVTTGAAGTNASVTNVGTEQRAILNFVIPRGDTGASGAEGSAGVGFDDADEISINDGNINITAGDNGVNIEASIEVAVGEEILEIPSTMYLPLKGSESIVIDVDESGDFIEIHLDADIAAKLGRVLVTPMSAPASVSLVAVDTSNAQTMLTLGSGLSVSGGVLSVSGGGGGGGAEYITINFTAFQGATLTDYMTTVKLPYTTGKQLIDYLCVVGFVSLRSTKFGTDDTSTSSPYLIVLNDGKCAYRSIHYSNNNFTAATNVNKIEINGSNVTSTDYTKTVVAPSDTIDIELFYSSVN